MSKTTFMAGLLLAAAPVFAQQDNTPAPESLGALGEFSAQPPEPANIPFPERAAAYQHPFLLIGHAGAPLKEPDNTLEGMAQALRDGANALETDVSITGDGVLVLLHDWDPNDKIALARQAGLQGFEYRPLCPPPGSRYRRPVDRLTLAELRKEYGFTRKGAAGKRSAHIIPTFSEFAAWLADKNVELVFLDIKIPEDREDLVPAFVRRLYSISGEHGLAGKLVFFSPYTNIIKAAQKAAIGIKPALRFGLDREIPPDIFMVPYETAPKGLVNVAAYNVAGDALALGVEFAAIGRPTAITVAGGWKTYSRIVDYNIRQKQGAALKPFIFAWTINDKEEFLWLAHKGVDGILTDNASIR